MRILFDIGGTNMRVAASSDGKTLSEPLIRGTPATPEEGSALLADFARGAFSEAVIESVCGGMPGVFDGTTLARSPLREWRGTDIKKLLLARFPNAAVGFENDAALAALGEATYGAGRGHSIVVYYSIGTGVGGARVVDGRIDMRRFGFEPGHQIIKESGETLEELVSGSAVMKRLRKRYRELSDSELQSVAEVLAIGIHNSILHWSPDIVILGGGPAVETPRLVPLVRQSVEKFGFFPQMPVFSSAALGERSNLWGALALSHTL